MAYRVELMPRARHDIRQLHAYIDATSSTAAAARLTGPERAIASLDQHPHRGMITPECSGLRDLAYGRRPRAYRIIYAINEQDQIVSILHIRHGARDRIAPSDPQ